LTESDRPLLAGEDLRGLSVVDVDGQDVGDVVDLVLDEEERHVRCLVVKTAEFPGFGEDTFLVPMEAVESSDNAVVRLSTTRERVASGPPYRPERGLDEEHVSSVYVYYEFTPFWGRP
jgi:sporulation protein YlmC with PRC-barrel domain